MITNPDIRQKCENKNAAGVQRVLDTLEYCDDIREIEYHGGVLAWWFGGERLVEDFAPVPLNQR